MSIGEGKTKLSLFALAIPIFFENIGVHLINVIQSALAARYAEGFFVTPMNVASNSVNLLVNVAALITTGMSIILSVYLGEKREKDSKEIVGTALIALLVVRLVIFGAAFVFAKPLISLQGLATEINSSMLPYSVKYFRGMCIINVFSSVSVVFSGALRCYGISSVGFIAGIASSFTTLILTYLAFYAVGVPENYAITYFIIIAAVATGVSIFINVFGFLKRRIPIAFTHNFTLLKKMVKVGFPATISLIMYSLSTVIAGAICVYLSNDMFLAQTYVAAIAYFTCAFGYSIGQANSIMVGRGCGMGEFDFVDRMFKQNLKITVLSNLVLSLLVAVFGKYLLRIYTDSQSIIAIGSTVFIIDIVVELGRGMNHIGQFGLNATGDTIYTTVVSVVSCWVCSVGIGYLLGVVCGLGVYGIWIASAVDEIFRGSLYLTRWNRGKWKQVFLKKEKALF